MSQDSVNLYGAQTLYMNVEPDGNANGVFLLNSNAMGKRTAEADICHSILLHT